MSPVLSVIVWLLVPAAVLPILTAAVLRGHLNDPSAAARDRSHLALVLAGLGVVTALLALNRLLGWNLAGEALTVTFAAVLLAVDILSGKWLYEYWTGGFSERRQARVSEDDG